MSTDIALSTWDPNSGEALPAYLSNALGDLGSNIADRQNVPSLSYEGKTWQIVKDGNKTKLQATNSDGDLVPVPVMRAVILNFNGERGRSYYEGTYNPAASSAPKCWSADGKAPDASVKEKQSSLCATCPMSVKGSKLIDGKESVACSSHRMIAVLPALDLKADPLRLKIAVTSDYDKEIVEHGWYAFRQYSDYLKSRGVAHTALVVTKIKFDPMVAYPKLLFAMDRVLSPDEVETIKVALANPKVAELLAEKWTAAGTAGTLKDDSDIKPHGLEGAFADGWVAHPDSAGWSYKGQEVLENAELALRYPAPVEEIPTIPVKDAAPAIPAKDQVIEHVAKEQPVVPAHDPIANAEANGWAVHPTDPAWYFKGEEVVSKEDLAAKYPAPALTAAAPPAPPPPPPAPAKVEHHDALAVAASDGWAVHPSDPAWMFKGEEVLSVGAVEAKYPAPNGAAAPAAQASVAPAAVTATTSTSDAAIPADVKELLNKWA